MAGIPFPQPAFNALHAALVQHLDPPRLGMFTLLCGFPLHSLAENALWPVTASAVLRKAIEVQWLGALLEQLVASTGEIDVGLPLKQACRSAQAAWRAAQDEVVLYAPHDRKAALVLFNDAPFVDRVEQREHVYRLVRGQGRRVMIVRGSQASGKSHTGLFVRHLLEEGEDMRMVPIRLDEMEGEPVGAVAVMTAIAEAMQLPLRDAQWDLLAQGQRQADKLAKWFQNQTLAHQREGLHWLLVIDALDHPRVGDDVHELVGRLMIAGARGDLVNVRLLLLALPALQHPPPPVAADVLDITLPPLTETDFRNHVVEASRLKGVQVEEAGVGLLTKMLIGGLQMPLDHAGMAEVRRRLDGLPAMLRAG